MGGHVEIVKLLLESGADVNIQGGRVFKFDREVLELLSQGRYYHTALCAACGSSHMLETVKLLLKAGADVNIQSGKVFGFRHGGT
jgi:ankyrin repeat protein